MISLLCVCMCACVLDVNVCRIVSNMYIEAAAATSAASFVHNNLYIYCIIPFPSCVYSMCKFLCILYQSNAVASVVVVFLYMSANELLISGHALTHIYKYIRLYKTRSFGCEFYCQAPSNIPLKAFVELLSANVPTNPNI